MSSKRFLLDVRSREAIVESLYVEHLHTTVRFLIGKPEDEDTLLDYIEEVVHTTEPLNIASGISEVNQRKWYKNEVKRWLERPFTILITDCFEICGFAAGTFVKNSKIKRSLELESDFTENSKCSIIIEIAKSNASSEEGKCMRIFIDEIGSYTSNFLSDDCEKYFQIDQFNVHPEYQGDGIEKRLWKELLKLARFSNAQYVTSVCTTEGSRKIAEKFNMKVKFVFPYSKFISNEELIFGEILKDGSTAAYLMIGKMDDISKELTEELPRLPDAYKLPQIERKVLDKVYVDRLGREIRYEIALPKDESVIRDYMINEYYRQTNIPRTLQCRREDGSELMTRFKSEAITQGLVILAVDNGKLCGLCVNRGIEVEKGKRESKEIVIPDDFTSLIDAQPLNHIGGKTVRAINAWMESYVEQLLPEDCDKYFLLNMLTIHPTYRGCAIANKLWFESLKLGRKLGYNWTQCMCSAVGSCKAAEKIGLKMVISIPYGKIVYKGKKLFEDGKVNDGGELFNMYIGSIDEILH